MLVLQVWMRSRAATTGPLAAYNAMKWLHSASRAPLILEQVSRPKKKARAKEDRGQVQAIVAEPGMLLVLEQLAAQLHQRGGWRCAAVCCTHTVATAVMRMGHLESTRFLRRTPSGYWLRAYRGKGRDSLGFRPAFDWFCPLLCTGSEPISPIQILHSVWDT